MPHGGPDWGTVGPVSMVHTLEDAGELAARLGSIDIFDRRGNIIWVDSFGDACIKWVGAGIDPSGNYAYLDRTYVKSGSQAVKIHTEDGDTNEVAISKDVPAVPSSLVGIEVSFCYLSASVNFSLNLGYLDGLKTYPAEVMLDPSTSKLYVHVPPDAYEEIGTSVSYLKARWNFQTLKLVVNHKTHKYMRVLLNEEEYKIPTLAVYEDDAIDQPVRYDAAVWAHNREDEVFGGDVWIDDIILTQNEPP